MSCCQNKISVNDCSTTQTCKITIVCQEFQSDNPFPRIPNGDSIDYSSISRFNNFRVFQHGAVLKILEKNIRYLYESILEDGLHLRVICLKVVGNNYRLHFDILFPHILDHYIHTVPNKYVSLKINMLLDIQSIVTKLLK